MPSFVQKALRRYIGFPRAGSVVGEKYRFIEPVGSGAMAHVWRAENILGSSVAIKFAAVGNGQFSEEILQSVIRLEGGILERLSGISGVIGYICQGEDSGFSYFVMEFLAGENLHERVDKVGPLPIERAVGIGIKVAEALNGIHKRELLPGTQMVSGDLKPTNVLLSPDEKEVRLCDFGVPAAAQLGRAGVFAGWCGNPAFTAPEIAKGEPITPASDMYSFGAILYFSITSRPLSVDRGKALASPGIDMPERLSSLLLGCVMEPPENRPTALEAHNVLVSI